MEGLSYVKDFVDLPESGLFERNFFDMILSRRAVRKFRNESVPRQLLEKIVQAVAFAHPDFLR